MWLRVEEMILALAGQFKQLSHVCNWKISDTQNFQAPEIFQVHVWADNCLNCPASAKIISSIQIILSSTMADTTICKVQLTFSCILIGYETKQKCDLLNSATRDTLRPRLYGEKLSRVEGSPAYPSCPGRANFSYISLQNLVNRLHEKQKSWLG